MPVYSLSAQPDEDRCLDPRLIALIQQQVYRDGAACGVRWVPADEPEQTLWILEAEHDIEFHDKSDAPFSVPRTDLEDWTELLKVWLLHRKEIGALYFLGNVGPRSICQYTHAGSENVSKDHDVVSRALTCVETPDKRPAPWSKLTSGVQYINKYNEPIAKSYAWKERGVYWTRDNFRLLQAPYTGSVPLNDEKADKANVLLTLDVGATAFSIAVFRAIEAIKNSTHS